MSIIDLFFVTDQIAVVTGGTRGIGLACATALAEAGARVVLVGRATAQGASASAALRERSFDARFKAADVRLNDEVDALMARVAAELGELDILVDSAGIAHHSDSVDFSAQDWRDVMDVNGVPSGCRPRWRRSTSAVTCAPMQTGSRPLRCSPVNARTPRRSRSACPWWLTPSWRSTRWRSTSGARTPGAPAPAVH